VSSPDGSRIAVINCNTSTRMTEEIAEGARSAAASGTTIIALQPSWGPESAEGYFDSFLTAAAVLDAIVTTTDTFDAVVMAGFGEHGREGAREVLDVPVVDITEAAAMQAMLLGRRYGVITTLPRARGQIEDSLLLAGLAARCVAIEATDLAVLDLTSDLQATAAAFVAAGRRAIDAGADVLCLGCAGFTAIRSYLGDRLGVPVVDSVSAGVSMAEGLVRARLRTSPAYAPPVPKARPGWPVSRAVPVP
jgi:allantoin racemase